jgi:uncharacterized protein (DUF1015 family)
MTRLLEPFTGYVPAAEFAHRVVGPPVSMLSPDQREEARMDPFSFRHVVGRGAGSSHAEARRWLRACEEAGALHPVGPMVAVYQQAKDDLVATGIIADVSVAAYESGLVKPHEATLAKTEKKMARYMRTTRIYGNPVALAHRPHPAIDAAIAEYTERPADYSFVAADGYSHALWAIVDEEAEALCARFNETLYITDGHHRLAAASSLAAREQRPDPHLPAGLFAATELRLGTFARCVMDPDLDPAGVAARLRADHHLEPIGTAEARPTGRHEFGVRIGGDGYRLRIDPALVPDDPFHSLDVNLLQDLVLRPVFGIKNPRKDRRLHFSPDLPHAAPQHGDCSAWFLPFPASIGQVFAIADAGLVLPPKSTRFAPKLPSGLAIRLLDRPAAESR